MADENLVSGHTPIWNYTASGINLIFKKELWKDRSSMGEEFYCVSEGVKLNLLVSIASVIEGSTKTYLRNRIYGLMNRKKQLDEMIAEHEEKSNNITEASEEIDNDEDNNDYDENFISFLPPIEELKTEAIQKEKNINDIILAYPDNRGIVQKILDFFSRIINIVKYWFGIRKELTSLEEEKLKRIVIGIEKSSWNNLVGHFNKVNNRKLKAVLDEQSTDLYEDISKIFQFRNFIVHSNILEQKFNENEIHFQGKSNKLIKYINDKGFGIFPVSGKYFIEILMPDDLIIHFKSCMDLFIGNNDFREDFSTSNLRNLVWR